MAVATFTINSYGIRATGGTDATTITSYKSRVKTLIFVAGGAADTCTITDADGKAIMILPSGGAAGRVTQVDFYDAPIDGMIITLSDAAGILIVILC